MIARFAAIPLALAVLILAADPGQTAPTPAVAEQAGEVRVSGLYRNEQYGFAIVVPPGTSAWMMAAPAPNHGLRLILGSRRTISVFGEFDAAGYRSATALLEALVTDYAARRVRRSPAQLGGRLAWRADFTHDGQVAAIVAQQAGSADERVNFVVELTTDRAHRQRDAIAFTRVLQSFRRIPRA